MWPCRRRIEPACRRQRAQQPGSAHRASASATLRGPADAGMAFRFQIPRPTLPYPCSCAGAVITGWAVLFLQHVTKIILVCNEKRLSTQIYLYYLSMLIRDLCGRVLADIVEPKPNPEVQASIHPVVGARPQFTFLTSPAWGGG